MFENIFILPSRLIAIFTEYKIMGWNALNISSIGTAKVFLLAFFFFLRKTVESTQFSLSILNISFLIS